MSSRVGRALLGPSGGCWLVALVIALPAAAAPMDLANPQPRWIMAAFEVSPADAPDSVDTVYTAPFHARLEPGPGPNQVTVTIAGEIVERHLLGNTEPVPGSFSDFVWIFDRDTGHVESAQLTGSVYQVLSGGLMKARVEAQVEVRMDTRRSAGFERPVRLFGRTLMRYCTVGSDGDCRPVPASAYDSSTGYVNAVGEIAARSSFLRLLTFSPLGEAIFSEVGDLATTELPGVSAAPDTTAAVSAAPAHLGMH